MLKWICRDGHAGPGVACGIIAVNPRTNMPCNVTRFNEHCKFLINESRYGIKNVKNINNFYEKLKAEPRAGLTLLLIVYGRLLKSFI